MKLNKRTAVAVTVGIWLAAAGAAAALTYELKRPLHAANAPAMQSDEPKPVVLEPLVQSPVQAPVLYLAEVVVVGQVPTHKARDSPRCIAPRGGRSTWARAAFKCVTDEV